MHPVIYPVEWYVFLYESSYALTFLHSNDSNRHDSKELCLTKFGERHRSLAVQIAVSYWLKGLVVSVASIVPKSALQIHQ